MRTAFLKTLTELAENDPRITLVVGDLGFSVVEDFARRFPSQFLNAGVAEQNMTSLAAGMALSGRVVFTYSIANFPTLRCLEQIRNDVCYHGADVKVVSVGGGYAYGALGSTHHATEDMAILRALPGMCVVAPGDPVEAAHATKGLAARKGPGYLRLGKAGEPVVHAGSIDFLLGRALILRDGRDIALISTGGMLATVTRAADTLSAAGISAKVISMHTLKPLDTGAITGAARETGAILTVEEHSVIGGLGSAVAECLAQSPVRAAFRIMGLPDAFCRKVGGQEYLRTSVGLSAGDIVSAARELVSRKGGN